MRISEEIHGEGIDVEMDDGLGSRVVRHRCAKGQYLRGVGRRRRDRGNHVNLSYFLVGNYGCVSLFLRTT
jgi:hypothetical protein